MANKFLLALVISATLTSGCSQQDDPQPIGAAGPGTDTPNQGAGFTPQYGAGDQAGHELMPVASAPVAVQDRNGGNLPQGALRFDRAIILDASGFEQPMAASTMFIPHGWQTQGGVFWGTEFMCTNGHNFNWSAFSPDGFTTIAILPQERWEMNNYGAPPSTPGCSMAPYNSAQSYLESVVQRWRPGSQIIDFRRRPDLERNLASYNSSTPMPMGESRSWVESGEILFAFNDRGRDMRGTVAASVVFSRMRTDAGMGVMDVISALAFPAYGVTAPNGQLDFDFFDAIRRTIKVNPKWDQLISGHNTAIGRVTLEEGRKRAAMISKSNDDISRIRESAWNSYQESSDWRAREFGEALRGVETYSDANAPGGSVELSNSYDNAWRLNDGSYVLSNDANFEPWRDLGVEGQRLNASQ